MKAESMPNRLNIQDPPLISAKESCMINEAFVNYDFHKEMLEVLINECGLSLNDISLLINVSLEAVKSWREDRVNNLSNKNFRKLLIVYCKLRKENVYS